MGKTDRRDLSPPSALREAIDAIGMGAGTETVPVGRSAGRVLAERVDAPIDVPGFDRAAMDGYAVRAADTDGASTDAPIDCDIAAHVRAGERPDVDIDPGEAAEITTGAVVPPGADAVVIVERTEQRDGEVSIRDSVDPGENVSFAGADIAAGSRALGPGTPLSPREVGLLAALGHDEVEVTARPTVGIVPTGAELVDLGEAIDHGSGQIYDTNTHTIGAGVREAGGEPAVYPRVGDNTDAIRSTLERAATECDLVLSSGSTSAGAGDVIHRVIEERGELLIHGVAVKPGKPTLVGRLGGAGYVGLPGYPVSALSIFRVFVAPAIREAAGLREPASGTVDARMALAERFTEERHRYVPVGLVTTGGGETLAYPVDKGSGATTSLAYADGVVEMAADREVIDAGTVVSVDLLSPDRDPPPVLGIGEDDPVVSRLLDRVDGSRYLPRGTRPGLRLFRDGVPDVSIVSGPTGATAAADAGRDAVELGGWSREWGLIVPTGNPAGIDGLGDLLDRDLALANRGEDSGLRASLGSAVAGLAAERGIDRHDVVESIEGFDRGFPGVESPARRVEAGRADAGVGLRSTAERLGLDFVGIGRERLRVLAQADRTEKAGVTALEDVLDSVGAIAEGLPGVEVE
ncbi:MAG: molybdopterin biosynthesis protein [Halobacteriales archaeon]